MSLSYRITNINVHMNFFLKLLLKKGQYLNLKTEMSLCVKLKISGANTERYEALNTSLQPDEDAIANCVQPRTNNDLGWLRFGLYHAKFWTLWIPKPSVDVCHKRHQYVEQCGINTGLKSK